MKHLRTTIVAMLIGMLLPQVSLGGILPGFDFRFPIVTDETLVAENLTNYEAYYDCTNAPAEFWTNVKEDGSDMRPASSTGVVALNYELVSFSTTSQTCQLHFNTGAISSTTPDTFYINYGSSTASDASTSTTWRSEYEFVGHMEETTGSSTDSGQSENNATFFGSLPNAATGQIGNAQSSDGVGDYIQWGDVMDYAGGTFSMSAWVNPTSFAADQFTLFRKQEGLESQQSYQWFVWDTDSKVYIQIFDSGGNTQTISSSTISTGVWTHIVVTHDGTNDRIYINGSLDKIGSNTRAPQNSTTTVWHGLHSNDESNNGLTDELRSFNGILTGGEIVIVFNNHSSSTAFFAAGAQESAVVNNIGGIRMGFGF